MAFVLLLTLSGSATAADDTDDIIIFSDQFEDLDDAPGFDTEPEKKDWRFSLGAIVGVRPDYEGSDDYEFAWAPDIKISWRDTIVLQGRSLRAVYRKGGLKLGPLIALESGRDDGDNNALRGLGDIDTGLSGGAFLTYEVIERLTLETEFRQEFAGGHGGALWDFGVGLRLPFEKPVIKGYAGATYASDDYMEEFFGVNAVQSANSGQPVFGADGGVKNVTMSLSTGFDIDESWVIGGRVIYGYLLGDAADSPIVDRNGSRHQVTVGVGLSAQF